MSECRDWRNMVAELVAKCQVCENFAEQVVFPKEGAVALGHVLQTMARELDSWNQRALEFPNDTAAEVIRQLRAERLLLPPEVPEVTEEMVDVMYGAFSNAERGGRSFGFCLAAAFRAGYFAMLSQQEKGDKA